MVKIRVVAAFVASLALAPPAAAQVPPDIAERVRAEGQVINRALDPYYAPFFGPEAWDGIGIERDVAYGEHPRHRLDVYVEEGAGQGLPVLLFVHGGGFVAGSKQGEFYPDNIGLWAARHGMLGVNINYRLAPDHPFPAVAEDLAAALAWVRANAAHWGGDTDRIVLFGHSAGGNHVADYVGHPQARGGEFAGVKGAVLLSPFYAADPTQGGPHAYYGTDGLAARAMIERLRGAGVPLFVGYAEYDPDNMRDFAAFAIEELCLTTGSCPASVHLADHNHLTEGMAVGTPDRSLTGPLLEWMEGLW